MIVVEHDEDAIRSADYLIDMGPGAGEHGGEVVAHGTPDEVIANPALGDRQTTSSGRRAHRHPGAPRAPDPEQASCASSARAATT